MKKIDFSLLRAALVETFANSEIPDSINELKMPNLEKYLSSRFAFSSNQTDNLCKYCEKFIPKSLLQHYRYCSSKKDFDFKNGIINNEDDNFEIEKESIENQVIEIVIPKIESIPKEKTLRKKTNKVV